MACPCVERCPRGQKAVRSPVKPCGPPGACGSPIPSAAHWRTTEVRPGHSLQGKCTEVPQETFLSQDLRK